MTAKCRALIRSTKRWAVPHRSLVTVSEIRAQLKAKNGRIIEDALENEQSPAVSRWQNYTLAGSRVRLQSSSQPLPFATGFFISSRKGSTILVTCAHVFNVRPLPFLHLLSISSYPSPLHTTMCHLSVQKAKK